MKKVTFLSFVVATSLCAATLNSLKFDGMIHLSPETASELIDLKTGDTIDMEKIKDIQMLRFHLDVNGKTVQEGCSCDMLYKVDEIISYISRYFTIKTGDLLYTGCPTGCGPVNIDDHLEGYLEDYKLLDFNCK